MISQGTLELLLSALMIHRLPAPQPPWWGKLLRKLLARTFWRVGRALFEVEVQGLEHFSNAPGTVVVSNHKTDFDIILLAPLLYRVHRGRGPVAGLAFVAAERMFQPGYFSTYLIRKPRWLSRLLYPVNLSAVLQAMRAYPIPHAHDRKLGAHLRELLALEGNRRGTQHTGVLESSYSSPNLPLRAVLRRPEALFPGVSPRARIRDVLRWTYHEALDAEVDFSAFPQPLEKALRERHLSEIFTCLSRFASILDEGDVVFFAPEGDLSLDGHFQEVKAGLPRLVRAAQRPVTLLPVNFTYDAMTVERTRAFLSIGPELTGEKSWPRGRLEAEVKRRILSLSTVTVGQLTAHALQELAGRGESQVRSAQLEERIRQEARRWAQRGRRVDARLLEAGVFRRRWRALLAYGQQEGLLQSHEGWLHFNPRQVLGEDRADRRASGWVYSANEFEAFLQAESAG